MRPYIILDRDGTINVEKNYLHTIDEFEFEKNAIAGLKLLQHKGYGLIVITNQSGIARGLYTIKDAEIVHEYMLTELYKYNVVISKVYMCPHSEEDNCQCRKPKIGLYLQAIKEYDIDIEKSYLIGDRIRDIEPSKALKSRCGLVKTGYFQGEDITLIPQNIIYDDLLDFAKNIPSV